MALALLKVSKKSEEKIRKIAKKKKCTSSVVINRELEKWINNQDNILEYDSLNSEENIPLYFKTTIKIRDVANRFPIKPKL